MVKGFIMSIKKNLTNQRFGQLTVISKAPSIIGGKSIKRYWGAWHCLCDCGKQVIVKTVNLTKGSVTSCGCLYDKYGKSLKPGQKINRLTTISYKKGKWFCVCECGGSVEVPTNRLTNGNTKSCGCLKTEVSKNKSDQLIKDRRQFDPKIASARRIWKSYIYRDKECNLTFDQFYQLSQRNCVYCGIKPSTEYNYFLSKSSNSSEIAKKSGKYIYNGLDRIDSLKYHTLDNVVPCCILCNRAKNNRSIDEFMGWIKGLSIRNFTKINEIVLPDNKSLMTSIRCIFYNYKKDTDLTLQEYYSISQMNCFYCDSVPNNVFNRAKTDKKSSITAKENGNYIYNGLDRIDPAKGHIRDNVVPCCKYCNFAKNKLTLQQFYNWMNRIKQYQKKGVKKDS